MDMSFFDKAAAVFPDLCFEQPPDLGIVLGSGWGEALVKDHVLLRLSYADIPGLGASTVPGHVGEFVLYERHGRRIAAFCGRRHGYEGVGMEAVVFPAELCRRMGVTRLLLTNASGGIAPSLKAGDLVVLRDHINLTGCNPLRGSHREAWGPRFPDMTDVYTQHLRDLLHAAAHRCEQPVRDGVYVYASGPSFETPAEIRAYALLGADVVGMSTVPEAVFAHACGMQVAGLSFVSNLAAGISPEPLSHEEVMQASAAAKPRLAALCDAFIGAL